VAQLVWRLSCNETIDADVGQGKSGSTDHLSHSPLVGPFTPNALRSPAPHKPWAHIRVQRMAADSAALLPPG
jgi:hypothetical protein